MNPSWLQIICYAAMDMELTGKELKEAANDFTEWVENVSAVPVYNVLPLKMSSNIS
jgi:hypothetical protein